MVSRKTTLRRGYRFKNRWVIIALALIDCLLGHICGKGRPLPDRVAKILLIKPDHLGDMLMLTSVVPLIKNRYKDADIDIVCGAWALPVLENNPFIRKRIVLNHPAYNRGSLSFFRKLADFFKTLVSTLKTLRRERYDLCLNFRDAGGDLVLLARLGNCRFIAGHCTGGFGPLIDAVADWREGVHEVAHYLEVAGMVGVGAPLKGLRYELYPGKEDYAFVEAVLERFGLTDFVAIHPGSGDKRKLRDGNFWARVVRNVDDRSRVAITGSKEEGRFFAEIAAAAGEGLSDLTGAFTILQLLVFFQRARHVYTLDSLAAHIAALSGTKATVFWNDLNDAEQWRPLGDNIEVVYPA